MKTDTFYTSALGGFISLGAYLIGGVDHLITALVIFMACDYITGILVGWTNKVVNSKRAFTGLAKKVAMFIMVIIANQLDLIMPNEGISENLARNAMILFLVGVEGISLTENLGKLGIPVPNFISERFKQLNAKGDR